jgi:hypothetical protein
MGLLDSPLCRKCGIKEETSAHILCECEVLAALRCRYLGSFFLEPEDIKSLSLGAIWSFSKDAGLPWYDMGHKGPVKVRPRCIGVEKAVNPISIYLSILPLENNPISYWIGGWGPCNWSGCCGAHLIVQSSSLVLPFELSQDTYLSHIVHLDNFFFQVHGKKVNSVIIWRPVDTFQPLGTYCRRRLLTPLP